MRTYRTTTPPSAPYVSRRARDYDRGQRASLDAHLARQHELHPELYAEADAWERSKAQREEDAREMVRAIKARRRMAENRARSR